MRTSILSLLGLIFFTVSIGAIDPVYKEASQRGYEINGDSVVLPNGELCSLADFNAGVCGKEFFDEDYCVVEGDYVWDDDRCCEGLVSYLPDDMDGQARCVKEEVVGEEVMGNVYFWFSAVAVVVIILSVIVSRTRPGSEF